MKENENAKETSRRDARELNEMDVFCCIEHDKNMCELMHRAHVYITYMDSVFIEWSHCISFFILLCVLNDVTSLLVVAIVEQRVCCSIHFYRRLKLLSVASQMWKMWFMNGISPPHGIDVDFQTYSIHLLFGWCVCLFAIFHVTLGHRLLLLDVWQAFCLYLIITKTVASISFKYMYRHWNMCFHYFLFFVFRDSTSRGCFWNVLQNSKTLATIIVEIAVRMPIKCGK